MKSRWLTFTQHWLWMIPLLLIVSGLAIHQIDRFPISIDELLSINNAGYVGEDASIPAILHNLETYSAQHVPTYFLILGFASQIVDWSPPILRMMGIWFGLLTLAGVYRLGRDYHSGSAGLYAVIFVAGVTLYSYYYAHIRMYTLLTMTATFFLWNYLRLSRTQRPVPLYQWGLLSLSTLLFLSSHIYSITLMIVVGLYHLLFVRKNRRWVEVSGAIIIGGLPLVLWLPVLLKGFQHTSTFEIVTTRALTPPEIFYYMLIVYGNSVLPISIALLGFLLYRSWRTQRQLRTWLFLALGTGGVILLIGGISPIIPPDRLRYTFVLLIPLSVAVGMSLAQFRYHVLVAGVILGLWLGSDLWMQRTYDMASFLGGRMNIYDMPRIDRDAPLIASATDNDTLILGFSNHRDLTLPVRHGNTVQDFYYDRVDRQHYTLFLPLEEQESDDTIRQNLVNALDGQASVALVLEKRHIPSERIRSIYDDVLAESYQVCETVTLASHLTLTRYVLSDRACPD